MATLVPDATKNAAVDAIRALITHLSLHESSPGTTGAAEATGGTPAYARKAVSTNAAGAVGPLGAGTQPATPGIAYSSEVTFDVDAATYSHWGAWTASTAGTYVLGNALEPGSITAGGQGQIKVWVRIGGVTGA